MKAIFFVYCGVLVASAGASEDITVNNVTVPKEVDEKVREISKAYREQLDKLDQTIAEKVKQLKEASTVPEKEKLTNEIKALRQKARALRDEFRQKLQELVGDQGVTNDDGLNDLFSKNGGSGPITSPSTRP